MNIEFDQIGFNEDNPEPRCPCALLLDTSSSMSGQPIDELNRGLQALKVALEQDALAMLRVEFAIITFGPVAVKQDFVTADQFVPPVLEAFSDTPMASAINLALDKIEERKQIYRKNGVAYYRPWIFLVTDGEPTDDFDIWQGAVQRVHDAEANKKVAFFSVGVEGANMEKLSQLSQREPLKLIGLNFNKMFVWLSASLGNVSHSNPGDEVPLQSPASWGTV